MTIHPENSGGNIKTPKSARRRKLRAGLFGLAAAIGLLGDKQLPDIALYNHPETQEIADDDIKIMTANVHGWQGYSGNNFDTFSEALVKEQPDIVCMQEVLADGEELRKLYEEGYNVLFSTTIRYPFRGRFGNAVLSRAPLSLVEVVKLPNPHTVTPRNGIMFAVETTKGKLDFFNTHLSTNQAESNMQAERAFHAVGDLLQGACGDFNQTPEQIALGSFGRMLVTRPPLVAYPTFPAREPSRKIDHVLSECGVSDPEQSYSAYIDSDHLAAVEVMDISGCFE
mgnify:CR=1 FL=1